MNTWAIVLKSSGELRVLTRGPEASVPALDFVKSVGSCAVVPVPNDKLPLCKR